jgi:hypothetical protein
MLIIKLMHNIHNFKLKHPYSGVSLLCKHKNMSKYYKNVHFNYANTDTDVFTGGIMQVKACKYLVTALQKHTMSQTSEQYSVQHR